MSVVLVVGHTPLRQGAKNKKSGISEYLFNSLIAPLIRDRLNELGVSVTIVNDKYFRLPQTINKLNPEIIVMLHCNAFNTKVHGSEVLVLKGNKHGLGDIIADGAANTSHRANRGVKQLSKGHRGYSAVKNTIAPCFIVEPFFIDNNDDLENMMRHGINTYVKELSKAIVECLNKLQEIKK